MITDWTKIKVNLNFTPRAVKGKIKQTNGTDLCTNRSSVLDYFQD